MKRILLTLALLLLPSLASAQCTGVWATGTVCGNNTGSNNTPRAIPFSTFGAITGLTGDGTATGPGVVPLTLATVNANVGTFGGSTNCITQTVNGKGLVTAVSQTACQPPVTVENFLPNVQWQSFAAENYGIVPITKQNVAGTGSQTAVSSTSFTINSNTPTFLTTNTREVKVGDIVEISSAGIAHGWWCYVGPGCVGNDSSYATGVRVTALVANTSITVVAPFAGASPGASTATTITPITAGELGGTGYGPDGWAKTATLKVWPDDFTVNSYPGAIRTLGVRKGAVAVEQLAWKALPRQLAKYTGRTITCGVANYQKVQSNAGTWSISIFDDVTGYTTSTVGSGTSAGGFQYRSVTATVNSAATDFYVFINYNGLNVTDVHYTAIPTCVFGTYLTQANLRQNINDSITSNHWNPPLLTPFRLTMPTVMSPPGSGLYGWEGLDMEALSMGTIHKSVAGFRAKMEFTSQVVGALLFVANRQSDPLVFGPHCATQVSGFVNICQDVIPLSEEGTFALFSNITGLVVDNSTFDLWTVELSAPAGRIQ